MVKASKPQFKSIKLTLVVSVFLLYYCFDYLLQISISTLLPTIQFELGLSLVQLGTLGAIFFVSYIGLQIPDGHMIDYFGARYVAIVMSVFCLLGAVVMSLINTYSGLLMSRLLIGVGSSMAFVCAVCVITQYTAIKYHSLLISVLQAFVGIGAILGQTPIAYLTQIYSWQQIAFVLAVISLLFVVTFLTLPKSDKMLRGAREFHPRYSQNLWHAAKKAVCNKLHLQLGFAGFVAWSPVASLAGFWLIPAFKSLRHIAEVEISLLLSMFWLGLAIGAILMPIVSEWLKQRKPILTYGFLLQFIAFIFTFYLGDSSLLWVIIGLFLLGFIAPIQGFVLVIAKDASQENFGLVGGILNLFGAVSGGIMQFLVGLLLSLCTSFVENPYFWVLLIYPILSLIAWFTIKFYLKETYQT
ncbi:MFS transporter [Cysteiniphilum sp. 6C5]|uniref:MFS transporter n=1 Tax=unclassified Cysteiniphilum TaxID=2610889 RepID=UPI003F83DE3C